MIEVTVLTVIQGLLAVLAIGGVALVLLHLQMSIARKGEVPVRWSWIPFLGFAIEMGIRPIELLQESADKFGEIFGLVVAGNRMFFINDCHSANVIFRATKDLSWEEFHHTILHNFFGTAMPTLTNHVLNEDLMRKWYSIYIYSDTCLHKLTIRLQKRLIKDSQSIKVTEAPLYDFVGRLIFKASIATIFNDAAADDEALFDAFMTFDKQLPICAAGVNLKYFGQQMAAREKLLAASGKYADDNCELVQMRRKHFAEIGVSDADSLSFHLAIFWASVGNTMPTTFWLLYYLLKNPELLAQAKKEVLDAYASIPAGQPKELSQEHLNNMIFIDACVTETIRLASGSLLMRFVRRPCELTLSSGNSYKFRKGDRIGLCPTLIHFDEEMYSQAKSFIPSRWIQGASHEERVVGSQGKIPMFKGGKEITGGGGFLPFGGGPTYCPGRRFARNEIKTLIALLLTHYNFTLKDEKIVPTVDTSRAGIGIFPPKDDIMVNISLIK